MNVPLGILKFISNPPSLEISKQKQELNLKKQN